MNGKSPTVEKTESLIPLSHCRYFDSGVTRCEVTCQTYLTITDQGLHIPELLPQKNINKYI